MRAEIKRLHSRIKRKAWRVLASSGLTRGSKVAVICAPTLSSVAALDIVVEIERKFSAEIEAHLVGPEDSLRAIKEVAEGLEVSYVTLYKAKVDLEAVLTSALRARKQGLAPITPFVSEDLACMAVMDSLKPIPLLALLDSLARAIHPLADIKARDAATYALSKHPGSRGLPPALQTSETFCKLFKRFDPLPARAFFLETRGILTALSRCLT